MTAKDDARRQVAADIARVRKHRQRDLDKRGRARANIQAAPLEISYLPRRAAVGVAVAGLLVLTRGPVQLALDDDEIAHLLDALGARP
jgi:hypothetical protein